MLAAIWDTPYNIVYVIHLLSVILGVGMAFLAPVLAVRARRDGGRGVQEFVDSAASAVIFPSLLVAGIAGGTLVGMSSDVYDFQQSWLSIGGTVWLIALALALAAYPPTWMRLLNLSDERRRMMGGMLHLTLAVMLVLMTWKFGV